MNHLFRRSLATIVLSGLSVGALAQTADSSAAARAKSFEEHRQAMKVNGGAKLGGVLQALAQESAARKQGRLTTGTPLSQRLPIKVQDNAVRVSAFASGDASALRDALIAKGMRNAVVHGNTVTGSAPIDALQAMATIANLRGMRPVMAKTQVGLTTSQGDRAQRSNLARQHFNVDGRGVRVGVMSDSFNCSTGPLVSGEMFTTAVDDITNNDLPTDIKILKDLSPTPDPSCTDEGRAMMQIVHDVAPKASLAFYTAFESEEDFAAGIVALADNGAQVIVDDVVYFAEPMFMNGHIAQAVDKVNARGVAYFSSAGNDARQSYEAPFRDSKLTGLGGGPLHDFARGKGVDVLQGVTGQAGSITLLSFQWDQPWFSVSGVGSASDVDVYFIDADGSPIAICDDDLNPPVCQFPGVDSNVDGDPIELPLLVNLTDEDVQVNLAIELFSGPKPQLMKYVYFDLGPGGVFTVDEYDTKSGTTFGHANAVGAESVGAAAWFNTDAFGPVKPQCVPGCLELFSSAGGTPLLFHNDGRRRASPIVGFKPGITAPDGGNTSFFVADLSVAIPGTTEPDGFPNFFGTSAAAPHAAAVAALMLDQRARDIKDGKHFLGSKRLTPEGIFTAMRASARDIQLRSGFSSGPFPIDDGKNFDFDSGFGLLDANAALRFTAGF
jgi:hypothetical protein